MKKDELTCNTCDYRLISHKNPCRKYSWGGPPENMYKQYYGPEIATPVLSCRKTGLEMATGSPVPVDTINEEKGPQLVPDVKGCPDHTKETPDAKSD